MKRQIPQAAFISRLLFQIQDDEPYWVNGTPPTPQLVANACAVAKDEVDFDSHRSHFDGLAEILDACIAEELETHGHGIAARNATKHPRVVALTKSDSQHRAGIATAAAQGLAWYEACNKWVQDHSLRNQIAKRVMTAILVVAGRVREGYSTAQLAAVARLGASMRGMDLFEIRARGAILEILAANIAGLARDKSTLTAIRKLVSFAAEYPANPQPVLKAIEKLTSFAQHENLV